LAPIGSSLTNDRLPAMLSTVDQKPLRLVVQPSLHLHYNPPIQIITNVAAKVPFQ